MRQYIGTKIIYAESATRGECYKGPDVLSSEKADKPGYRVKYPDGYESWSPRAVFEEAYHPTNKMNFGLALDALKANKRVVRKGWNGKDAWLRIVIPGGDNKEKDMGMENLPYIEMKTSENKLVPWLASQMDMLADDWQIVE
jgi:hypothetical protein